MGDSRLHSILVLLFSCSGLKAKLPCAIIRGLILMELSHGRESWSTHAGHLVPCSLMILAIDRMGEVDTFI
jgi:hypothetical protein